MSASSHDQLYCIRHSLSHVLAQALQRTLDPSAQLWTWPAIEDGFYYDVSLSKGLEFKEENLKELGKVMEGIVKEGQGFWKYTAKDKAEALMICDLMKQDFKKELIEKFYQADNTAQYTFYYNFVDSKSLPALEKKSHSDYIKLYTHLTTKIGELDSSISGNFITFLDLCEGGHVENLKELPDGCFAMNRTIGAKMKLFTISELVGSGLPLFQPNGMILRKEITDYLWELHKNEGYQWVWTPHIAKEVLYTTSGHAKHYMDDMFKVHGGTSNEDFYIKPMNCPHHMQLFADNAFSYRDMPIRYFEPATVYRDEKPGQLSGLTRVRNITQDDGHLFCRTSQIKDEANTIVSIIKKFYETMGMFEWYWVSLSLRGEDKENYLWSDEMWEEAENALREVCISAGLNYKEVPGEAAFYGPKLDFMFRDAIGRYHQLGTCQVDWNLPERFDLSFTNEQGEKERPIVIHRAIAGSLERFIGVMVENFAGDFPLWLSPEQIRVVPVAEVFTDYAKEVQQLCNQAGLRAKVDTSDDSFSKKIRNAETDKVYYVLIVGEKEVEDNTVSLRNVRTKEQEVLGLEAFVEKAFDLYSNRGL